MPGRPKVVLRGQNVMQPPLFETTDAHIIEFRDGDGELMALFCKVLSDDFWGLVTKNDDDWTATLIRHGYMDLKRG